MCVYASLVRAHVYHGGRWTVTLSTDASFRLSRTTRVVCTVGFRGAVMQVRGDVDDADDADDASRPPAGRTDGG